MSKHGNYGFFVIERHECPRCHGVGMVMVEGVPYIDEEECPDCNGGHGYIETEVSLQDALRGLATQQAVKS